MQLDDVRLALPAFRYRAVMPDGVVENEICPVFTATTAGTVRPDPDEVDSFVWVGWPEFRDRRARRHPVGEPVVRRAGAGAAGRPAGAADHRARRAAPGRATGLSVRPPSG